MSILASYKTSIWIPSVLALVAVSASAQPKTPPSPAKQMSDFFGDVHGNILDMAKDFPAEKYDFRLKPEMRTFGEVIVHLTSGVVYAAKAGMGEKANWDELDAKSYRTKADI